MTTKHSPLGLFAVLCSAAVAQPTGIPNFNDYTINGSTSGSTSCTFLPFTTPTVLNFQVSTSGPGNAAFILISAGPCSPNSIPTLATCQGTTFDLATGFGISILFAGPTTPAGTFNALLPLPPLPSIRFSTQAVIIDPACGGLPLFSQAYQVSLL
jgi:hypothetical protein